MDDDYPLRGRTLAPAGLIASVAVVGMIAILAFGFVSKRSADAELAAVRADVVALEAELARVDARSSSLATRLQSAELRLQDQDPGVATLAAKVLRSVFTVQTSRGLGAAFAAWTEDGDLYLVTADHVVAGAGESMTVERKAASWGARVVARDTANDLAVLLVSGQPAGAVPLWQKAQENRPRPGDELLLVGSPYGLAGTVTTGIVSRVSPTLIQTDAAANPGNSGGPAVDGRGRVVGVLVSGGGENLNFAVPVGRLCLKLRDCD
jgi:S1-C subfamily serine protease